MYPYDLLLYQLLPTAGRTEDSIRYQGVFEERSIIIDLSGYLKDQ